MNPQLSFAALATTTGAPRSPDPSGAAVASPTSLRHGPALAASCVDYIGNGVYTVTLTNYNANCSAPVATHADALPFTITASTAITSPPTAQLTRKPGLVRDQHGPAADRPQPRRAGDRRLRRRSTWPPTRTGRCRARPTPLFPDSTTRTVGVPLDKGPGTYVVAARAKGFTGSNGAVLQPVGDAGGHPRVRRRSTSSRSGGPTAVGRATGSTRRSWRPSATGKVNVAIGRGTKGKYKSFGTAKIRKHAFSKRFRLSTGKWRIRFKYKGNARWPAGSRCGPSRSRATCSSGARPSAPRRSGSASGRRTSVLPRKGKTDVRPRRHRAARTRGRRRARAQRR